MKRLNAKGVKVMIYEPSLKEDVFFQSLVKNNLAKLKQDADLIIVNRNSHELNDVGPKVHTRDLFGQD